MRGIGFMSDHPARPPPKAAVAAAAAKAKRRAREPAMMMTLAAMATKFDGGNTHGKKMSRPHGRVLVCVCVWVWAGGQAAGRHLGPGLEVNNNRALRLQLASNQNNRSHLARTRSIPTVPLRTCQAHSSHHLFCFCFFGNKKARAGKRTAICALWEREGAFGGLIGTPTSPFERDPKNRWFPYALRARS